MHEIGRRSLPPAIRLCSRYRTNHGVSDPVSARVVDHRALRGSLTPWLPVCDRDGESAAACGAPRCARPSRDQCGTVLAAVNATPLAIDVGH